MQYEFIEIEKEETPYTFETELGAEIFELEIRHNDVHDHFTVDVHKDGEPLIYGEKIIYGIPLFRDYYNQKLPGPTIIPLDPSGNEDRVTYENINETVFLVIDNGE